MFPLFVKKVRFVCIDFYEFYIYKNLLKLKPLTRFFGKTFPST